MEAPLIVAIVFGSIVAVVKIISDSRIKSRLIEKDVADERVRRLFQTSVELHSLSSLKWGMVLVGIGLAAFISEAFPRYRSDEVLFGLIFVFAGVAFLIYFALADKRMKQLKGREPEQPQV